MQISRLHHVLMQAWAAQGLPLLCLQTSDSVLLPAIPSRLLRPLRADLLQGLSLSEQCRCAGKQTSVGQPGMAL